MSKANYALTTPEASAHTRRDLLISAGPAAVAVGLLVGSVQTAAAPSAASAAFLHYLNCRQLYARLCDAMQSDDDLPTVKRAGDATHAACLVIRDRAVHSWRDVAELGYVVREELWDWDKRSPHSENEALEAALLAAIEVMASQEGFANG